MRKEAFFKRIQAPHDIKGSLVIQLFISFLRYEKANFSFDYNLFGIGSDCPD